MAEDLTIRYGDEVVRLRPGTILRVGRDEAADLRVDEADVSRRHARFEYLDGWQVHDEGSTNGTWVDGARVASASLSGDVDVRLGAPDSPARLTVQAPAVVPVGVDLAGGGTVLKGAAPQPFRDQPAPQPLAAGTPVITIGKAPDNDVVVDDINVSRHHARVVVQAGGFLVEDLNSLNGTLLNAVPVQRAFMGDGDRLTVGNTDFVRLGDGLVPARRAGTGEGGLDVRGLGFTIAGGKRLIADLTMRAGRGTLTAVIGPSGAGKSTLSRLLAGTSMPTDGAVAFDGFDLQRDYQAVKTRVGLVPQDDVVHRQLLTRTALRYAAELRLARDLSAEAKRAQVDKVIGQLGLEHHAGTRIERLSGGQRKRASVALELLTEPSLLILDEPTSGLDPALDRQVMQTLRGLADGDRTVLVITHSVACLDMCDQVLVLAPGGLPAYLGHASGIIARFGTDDWGDIFAGLAADPEGSHRRWVELSGRVQPAAAPAATPTRRASARGSSWVRQLATVAVRQANVMVSDRGYLGFLLALPVILGLLPYVVPGSHGLTKVAVGKLDEASEPTFVLALLIMGATFMGVSMAIRDLIGERAIFLRERAVGLSPSAYLLAKLIVFGLFSALSAAIMTLVMLLVKKPPTSGVMHLGPPLLELFLPIALTTWVGAALGLAISALATSNDQVMPVLILVLMVELVLHGGLIPVLGRDGLNAVSKAIPARWGFAAGASGIGLEDLLKPGRPPGDALTPDPIWNNTKAQWLVDMAVLAGFGAVFSVVAGLRLRTQRR